MAKRNKNRAKKDKERFIYVPIRRNTRYNLKRLTEKLAATGCDVLDLLISKNLKALGIKPLTFAEYKRLKREHSLETREKNHE